jgi:hypothetical protein
MADPTLTMVPVPTATPPEVRLELNWPKTPSAQVERLGPDGVWSLVRTGEPAALTGGQWFGHDVEAPYGTPLRYRASAGGVTVDGLTRATGGFDPGFFDPAYFDTTGTVAGQPASLDVYLDVSDPWLIDPGRPSLSQPIRLHKVGPQTSPIRQATFLPIGADTPIVLAQQRGRETYTITVKTDGVTAHRALGQLLAGGSTLLWNVPESLGWDLPTGYVAVGAIGREHRAGYGADPVRLWTLPLTLTRRPAGGQAAAWSYDALAVEQDTYPDVAAHYATYRDLLAHQPTA